MPATSVPTWRKSTFSGDGGTDGGNCVEAALIADRFAQESQRRPGVPPPQPACVSAHVHRIRYAAWRRMSRS